jgi:Outer membrane protein beta-barrel domain
MVNYCLDFLSKLTGNFMKKLFACLLMVGSAGLASAQVSNFTGLSGAVNLSAASTNLKTSTQYNLGADNWLPSFQGAYGLELSSSSVLGMGLTYAAGKSKSGNSVNDDKTIDTIAVKSQYSLYLEPGSMLSDNTLLYGKVSLEKGKGAVTAAVAKNSMSKSVSGTGYGVGMRHMLDKSKFVQVELMKVGYKSVRFPGETTDIKFSSTLGTIGIGMKF